MIDARDWVFACRAPAAWTRALAWKRSRRLEALRSILDATPKSRSERAAYAYVLERAAREDAIVLHPAFHSWLHAASRDQTPPGAFEGFAAAAALAARACLELEVRLDGRGRFHLHGLARYLDLGPKFARASAKLQAAPDVWRLRARAGGGLCAKAEAVRTGRGARGVGALPLIAGRMELNVLDPHVLSVFAEGVGTYDHKIDALEGPAAAEYARVLRRAVSHIRAFDAALCEELLTDIRVLVPLRNPGGLTSVSSTYSSLQGAIGLSHSPDALVQAETLIHEFSHNKLNLLLEMTPLFDPRSPSEAAYYSPWREDRRPLRGLLLGAHAFLNAARFGGWCLRSLELEPEARRKLSLHLCKTLLRVECALRGLAGRGIFTAQGRRVLVAMTTALSGFKKEAAALPPEILAESRAAFDAHRAKYSGL